MTGCLSFTPSMYSFSINVYSKTIYINLPGMSLLFLCLWLSKHCFYSSFKYYCFIFSMKILYLQPVWAVTLLTALVMTQKMLAQGVLGLWRQLCKTLTQVSTLITGRISLLKYDLAETGLFYDSSYHKSLSVLKFISVPCQERTAVV